jgi:HEAT repeat protein
MGGMAVIAVTDFSRRGGVKERETAKQILAGFEKLQCLPVKSALDLLNDPSPVVRRQAIESLQVLRPSGLLAAKPLAAALDDPASEVRLAAIKTLGSMQQKARSTIPKLTKLESVGSETERKEAKAAIYQITMTSQNTSAASND